MLVYMLVNDVEEKVYIGRTFKSREQRVGEHIANAMGGSMTRLHTSLREFAPDCWWSVTLLECETLEQAVELEALWIERCDSVNPNIGYNERNERNMSSTPGKKHNVTPEMREKYREWGRKGAQISNERQRERVLKELDVAKRSQT